MANSSVPATGTIPFVNASSVVALEADISVPERKFASLPPLKCPDCGAGLAPETEERPDGRLQWKAYSVIDCCKPWSIVAGIPIFQHRPRMARLIRAGQHDDALCLALRPEDFAQRPSGFVEKLWGEVRGLRWKRRHARLLARNATFKEWLDAGFPDSTQNVRDYYFYKFTTPKHLAALSVASTLPPGACLDIGCGTGQITRALARIGPVTGIDRSFWLLYLAKALIAPDANFVCCDAELPLPFLDDAFSSVMSSNAFHFIRNQEQLLRECRRVADGPIALTSLRHIERANKIQNVARDFAGYTALAASCGMHAHIVDEVSIVKRYLNCEGPDFQRAVPPEESTDLITLLLDGEQITHGRLENWLHTGAALNPLYRREGGYLHLSWPSSGFNADNPGLDYLPETSAVDAPHHLTMIDLPERYG